MVHQEPQRPANALLERLSPENRAAILAESEEVELQEGTVVNDAEHRIEHVVFPFTCVLSTLSILSDGSAVETAVIGSEGVAPLGVFHGVDTVAERTVVTIRGEALQVPAAAFLRAAVGDAAFARGVHRFAAALFTFTSQTSGCSRRHSVVERCASWLLQAHDRVQADQFRLTHLFLSQLLGVRRSSVTVAAETLRAAGAISYTRGTVRVVDRDRLLSHSCECYGIVRSTYDRLMGSQRTAGPLVGVRISGMGTALAGPAPKAARDTAASRA